MTKIYLFIVQINRRMLWNDKNIYLLFRLIGGCCGMTKIYLFIVQIDRGCYGMTKMTKIYLFIIQIDRGVLWNDKNDKNIFIYYSD